ncbi:prepilin-type N-terminal cleavage/methylation domain-containing protein [Shewanella fodinae]|uniref:MSHA pilin protein MshC n=1 Tax=Shewanella fodinae TaxID=552357 RepID=A0A4R2FC56_9GAMM|nr:prepilin-type N-terminal cleavage/methylation domain-containing protein [Shewanella fodinae]TCN86295.1 MSHA pilin protein MshC [Shewanella fodinae]
MPALDDGLDSARNAADFKGFTLVELVVTILLLAILSVVVLPKFIGAGSFSAYAVRQQFISELRRVQMLAVNNPDRCYRLLVNDTGYRVDHLQSDCSTLLFSEATDETPVPANGNTKSFPRYSHIEFHSNPTFSIQFDSDGRSIFFPGSLSCSGACLQVIADETLEIAIESEGYIHES